MILVRKDLDQYHAPKIHYTAGAGQFMKQVLDVELEQLGLKMEAFMLGKLGMRVATSRLSKTLTMLSSETESHSPSNCPTDQTLLRLDPRQSQYVVHEHTLVELTPFLLLDLIIQKNCLAHKLQMDYDNYEKKIVEAYGVVLEGWPMGKIQNPGKLGGHAEITKLLDSLQEGTCHWKKLTAEELRDRIKDNKERAAAGEEIYKARKKPVHMSTPHATSTAIVRDSEREAENGDEN
jgi:hypothetical protein